jgi:hypothetical protein
MDRVEAGNDSGRDRIRRIATFALLFGALALMLLHLSQEVVQK